MSGVALWLYHDTPCALCSGIFNLSCRRTIQTELPEFWRFLRGTLATWRKINEREVAPAQALLPAPTLVSDGAAELSLLVCLGFRCEISCERFCSKRV